MVFQKLLSRTASLAAIAAIVLVTSSEVDAIFANKAAEEAKWLVSESNWGYATGSGVSAAVGDDSSSSGDLTAAVLSYGMDDNDGRLYFYLMGAKSITVSSDEIETTATATATATATGSQIVSASLTLSEAAVYPKNYNGGTCGDDGTTDPEDPRCAKLTISGTVAQCSTDECTATGKKALFSKHPEMEHWPAGHGFKVFEMTMTDLWMIYSYGGGSVVTPEQYTKAKPKHHKGGWPTTISSSDNNNKSNLRKKTQQQQQQFVSIDNKSFPMPDKSDLVARARWIVAHSLWTTVSTTSVRLNGQPWGNIRSMGDGPVPIESIGLPYFYLPTPDPTAVDVRANNQIILSFSESSLSERVDKSKACNGLDAMDPLCARVHLYGTATKIIKTDNGGHDFMNAIKSLGQRHPLAPWLAKGGAHTGGDYYTITLSKIVLLDNFGGPVSVSVDEYLSFSPSTTTNTNIVPEEVTDTVETMKA